MYKTKLLNFQVILESEDNEGMAIARFIESKNNILVVSSQA
jgi:hypothetical protein